MVIWTTHILTIIYDSHILDTCKTTYDHMHNTYMDSHIWKVYINYIYDHMLYPYIDSHIWQSYTRYMYDLIWSYVLSVYVQAYMTGIYDTLYDHMNATIYVNHILPHIYVHSYVCPYMVVTHDSHMCAVIYDSLTQSYTNTFFVRIWLSYMF